MNVELLSVGTELLLGEILNTNAQYLSQQLSAIGADVYYQTTVGDNPERLMEAVKTALSRADVLIATGGLGPTQDDITKEVAAEALGFEMEFHAPSYEAIKRYFQKSGREMSESNRKQAMMPKGSIVLENTCGTAPGCIMEKDGKTSVILPGPPSEMREMFEKSVKSYIMGNEKIYERNIKVFGMGESRAAELLDDLISKGGKVTVAPYALTGEVRLRIAVKTADAEEAEKITDSVTEEIKRRLGDVVYSCEGATLPETTVGLLIKNGLTISAAESCTGGSFAKMITDVSGASAVLGESYVTYAPEAKIKLVGVKPETIKKYTVVSEETAREMAEGAMKASGADIGVSFTGFAGPQGDDVGLVYMGIAAKEKVFVKKLRLNGNRDKIRYVACLHGFDEVRKLLIN